MNMIQRRCLTGPVLLMLPVLLLSAVPCARAGETADIEAFLGMIQARQLTDEVAGLYGLTLPVQGPADPKTLGELGDVLGDLTYREDTPENHLSVLERAARLRGVLITPGSEAQMSVFNDLYGAGVSSGALSDTDRSILFSVAGGEGYTEEVYLAMLSRTQDLLARLRQDPAILEAHNLWNGTQLPAAGPVQPHDVSPLFGLTGDPAFVPAEYARLLPRAIKVWRGIARLNGGEDFNLLYGGVLNPEATQPSVVERGLIMGIVGGYWGNHLNEQESFNYFRVLKDAAAHLRELRSDPDLLNRYNRRFSTREVPSIQPEGPITEIKTREQLLYLVSQAVIKRMSVRRYLSTVSV